MDVEKDVAIRGKLGLHTDFSSHPYHVIPDDNLLFCQMRHSFLFDFKLSTYVIEPLLNAASNLGVLCKEEAIKKLAEHTAAWRAALPPDYFPAGNSWYCYDRVLIDKAKLHVRKLDPLLR